MINKYLQEGLDRMAVEDIILTATTDEEAQSELTVFKVGDDPKLAEIADNALGSYQNHLEHSKIDKELFPIKWAGSFQNEIPKLTPWLINNLIKKDGLNLLAAESGMGKSLIALLMALAVSQGERFLNEDRYLTEKTKTLYIDQEMGEDLVLTRLKMAAQGNADDNLGFYIGFNFRTEKKEHVDELVNVINDNGFKFIVVDTLSMITNKNLNIDQDADFVMSVLLDVRDRTGCTFLIVHHTRKDGQGVKEELNQHGIKNSAAIVAKCDTALMIGGKKIDRIVDGEMVSGKELNLVQVKNRATGLEKGAKIQMTFPREGSCIETEVIGLAETMRKALEAGKEKALELVLMNGGRYGKTDLINRLQVGENKIGRDSARNSVKALLDDGRLLPVDVEGDKGKMVKGIELPGKQLF